MAYATTSDVEVELGRPASSPTESSQWQAWLERVERAIVRGFSRAGLVLSDEIADGRVSAEDVADVEVARVLAKIENPTGVTSVTRSIDDASITTRREGGEGGDPLWLNGSDWELLLPDASSGAFSTRPGFEPDLSPWPLDWT